MTQWCSKRLESEFGLGFQASVMKMFEVDKSRISRM